MPPDFGLSETASAVVVPGDVFGRLRVISTGERPGYKYFAVCVCDCGSGPKAIRFDHLRRGITVSCGCVQKERSTTHGMTSSGHLGRWRHMMDRCYNETCRAWPDYGGRGIKVDTRWHDVSTFVAELPPGYHKGLEIDRIDNDGNYEPGNVRWVTRQKNTTNRRSARLFTLNGRTQSLTDWSVELRCHPGVILTRIDELGWSIDRALTEPVADRTENMIRAQSMRWIGHTKKPAPDPFVPRRFLYQGAERTTAEISTITGIDVKLLRKRLCERGWPVEKATKI